MASARTRRGDGEVPAGGGEVPAPMDDGALARWAAQDPTAAAAALWDRFAPQVHRIVARSLGRHGDVDDLVQEVFLRLFRNVARLRDPGALHGFVLTVTGSVIASELRRRKVRRFLGVTHGGQLPELPTLPADMEGREALARVYQALNQMKTRWRLSFLLHMVEGLTLAQVAAVLDVSVPTVRRSLAEANARLRRLLESDPALEQLLRGGRA